MTKFLRASAVGVLCTLGASTVIQAQTVTCQNAQYGSDVLARFPNIAKACSEIIAKNGAEYAVVKAKLDRVDPSGRVSVRVKQSDGSYSKRMSIQPRADLRVMADGKPVTVRDLATPQEITAYVKVRAPEIAFAPAEPSDQLVFLPIEEPQPQLAALPSTAGILPSFGLLGVVSLTLGALLSVIRSRR